MVNGPLPASGFEEFLAIAQERSIPWRFESQVVRYADRIAIEDGPQSWTYQSLNEAANRIARAILQNQELDNNPVALFFSPGFNAIASILGVLKAGRAWVPMVPGDPIDRLRVLLSEASSFLVLTDFSQIDSAKLLARSDAKIMKIEDIIGSGTADDLEMAITPETVSNIVFTAGSTGRPKGVVHTHGMILNNIMVHTNSLYITAQDRICQVASYTTLAGESSIFRALLNGATLLPFNTASEGAANLARWLIEKRITVCQIVPTLFRSIVQCVDESATFPDMRILHLGGEPVYRKDVLEFRKRFPKNCRLLHNLGSSEAPTIRQFFVDHDSPVEIERLPVGYPVPGREITLLDDADNPVDFDQIGEVVVRSRYLAQGYWRQPELTRQMFQLDPSGNGMRRFRTGDLGSMSRDGCLQLHGRKDSQVKIHGYRVEVQEVEAILLSMDGIDQVAVTAFLETDFDRLVAHVVLRPGSHLTEESILKQLRQKLTGYMVPGQVVILPRIPLTATGKVDRMALQATATRNVSSTSVPPSNPVEQVLCEIWSEILGRPVGITESFFDLGGDSLSGSKILASIEAEFGIQSKMEDLFDRPTVAAMAKWLSNCLDA